ncbi:MAG TPA: CHAT domain-containing protein [Blastocatellia bacterium]|nr:CHAT domain-containing protein [Blastocatellia bacterium]
MFTKGSGRAVAVLAVMVLSLGGFGLSAASVHGVEAIPLELNHPIERQLTAGQTHLYTLQLRAGQFFEARVERWAMVLDVRIVSPSGQTLAETGGEWENRSDEIINHLAAEDGTYRLEIRLLFPQAAGGPYRLKMVALGPPTEADRHRVLGNRAFASAHRRRLHWNEESRQAIAEFQEAIRQWQAAGDRTMEGITYSSLATVYRSQGDLPQSTDHFERALAIARATNQQSLEVEAMTDLSYGYAKQGQVWRGVIMAREALEMARARGDRPGQCRTLLLLGGITNAAGNVRTAEQHNREALSVCQAARMSIGEKLALTQIADGRVYLGEPQQALTYFNRALQIQAPVFDAHAQGYIRFNLARLKLQTGELQEALAQAQLSLESYRQIGSRDWQAHTRLVLGRIYQALGDDQQALHSFDQAFDLSTATGDPYLRALSLCDLAGVAIRLGRQAEAERYLEHAAEAFRENGTPSSDVEAFKQLGQLELLRRRPAAAVEQLKPALALCRKQELAARETEILWMLGAAYLALDDREQAAESFRQALGKARDKRLPDFEIQALGGLARLARMQGEDREAQALLETALDLIETSRARIASPDFRVSFFSATQSFYEAYIGTLMAQHARERGESRFAALALQAVERARGRSLLDLLTEAHADIRQGIDPALLDRERKLQQRISAKAERLWRLGQSGAAAGPAAAIKTELDSLTLEQRDLSARIRIQSPRYAALRQPHPLTLAEIQQQVLDSDTLLLEYALGEERSFLFAVTPTRIQAFTLPGRREIEPLITELLASMVPEQSLQQRGLKAASALSRILLAPARELLGRKRLLVVSDGLLQYLPFAALPDPGGRRQPLVIDHEIVSIPSASTLAVLRRELQGRETAPLTVAVLADPVFGRQDERLAGGSRTPAPPAGDSSRQTLGEEIFRLADQNPDRHPDLPRLPGTRREAEAILSLVTEAQRKVALDFDASRATATSGALGQYRYLHFATHGLLNSEHPELSGLVLSLVDREGRRQDGILRTQDIYNLKLPVELVVLSACRTALGKEKSGEGLMGLTRGFFYAGARRVIASLWVVSDTATAELMRRFYRELLGPRRLPPAAALRAAQISMWKESKWNAPYYWAAFTLQGEW